MKVHLIYRWITICCAVFSTTCCVQADDTLNGNRAPGDRISPEAFADPPIESRPGAYWAWPNGTVDHANLSREMEEAKALGMRVFEIWDIGALIDPKKLVPAGPAFLGKESLASIKHAMTEAERLGLELGMIAASSWNAGGAWVEKSDGSKRLASSALDLVGPMKFTGTLPLPCDDETYFRDVCILAVPQSSDKEIPSLELVIDPSGRMDENGRLHWNVPNGNWTVLRFVCRGTNQGLVVPSPNSDGLLIDHLNAEATERHMLYMIDKIGKVDPDHAVLKIMSHDSYEVNPANDWTEDFADQFEKRRRYDPRRYLPLLEGWKLADSDIQARFVADYRKTVGELLVERHFRVSREVLNRNGMKLCAEAGHGGYARVDPIWAIGESDIPRGEFWNGKRFWVTKEAASAAHLYGRRFVDSESFTGWRHWLDGPLHYKQLFDVALCAGLNRLTFHTFTHNPPQAGLPGYVYHAGEHFNANNTLWKQSGPMLTYMGRCSYRGLRRGRLFLLRGPGPQPRAFPADRLLRLQRRRRNAIPALPVPRCRGQTRDLVFGHRRNTHGKCRQPRGRRFLRHRAAASGNRIHLRGLPPRWCATEQAPRSPGIRITGEDPDRGNMDRGVRARPPRARIHRLGGADRLDDLGRARHQVYWQF